MPDFLRVFVDADLAVPRGGEIKHDGSGFQPLLFDKESAISREPSPPDLADAPVRAYNEPDFTTHGRNQCS